MKFLKGSRAYEAFCESKEVQEELDKVIKIPDFKKGWEESIVELNDLNLNNDIKRYEDLIRDSYKDDKEVKVTRCFDYDEYLGIFCIRYYVKKE